MVDGDPLQPSGELFPDQRLANEDVADNVDALLETVRSLLAREESRDQSFNARGVGLAGFVGIIVSLTTSVGRDALSEPLATGWTIACTVLFGLALCLLIATVVIVIRGVLMPRETAHLSYAQVARYQQPSDLYQARVMTQGRTLRGLIEVLGIERSRGNAKAEALHLSYVTLVGGLVCIAALGFILALSDAKVIPNDTARRSTEFRLCLVNSSRATSGATAGPVELAVRASCP